MGHYLGKLRAAGTAAVEEEPAPFAQDRELSEREIATRAAELERSGVRLLPYPFARCISIVSDHDHTERIDYEAYRDLLVTRLGLDFRDSFYLYHDTDHRKIRTSWWTDHATLPAVAWFGHDGGANSSADRTRDRTRCLSFLEVVREAHRGNLDHVHGFSWFGTRLLPLRVRQPGPRSGSQQVLVFPVPQDLAHERVPPEWLFQADDMPVLAVAVQLERAASPVPFGIELVGRDGRRSWSSYAPVEIGDGWRPCFALEGGPVVLFAWRAAEEREPPLASELVAARISFPAGERLRVGGTILASMHREELLRILGRMSGRYGFSVSLLVDHAGRTFLNVDGERGTRALVDARMTGSPACSVYGLIKREDAYFSTLADDPEAINYVLPELVRDFSVRFVNPGHVSGELCSEFSIFNVVVPTTARDGARLYLARRTFPPLPESLARDPRRAQDAGTRSLPHRLDELLELECSAVGSSSPVYTHLGNVLPKRERARPYYRNISGEVPAQRRVWFSPPTQLYDYALILRELGRHVSHPEEGCIRVSRWHDEVLDRELPVSQQQLHGVTFYVSDRDRARVFLGDEEVRLLQRNRADMTGRESVTVVGDGIRWVIFDEVDPAESTAGWSWHEGDDAFAGSAFGRLRLPASGELSVVVPLEGVSPSGAQHLAFAVRSADEAASFGITLDTATGGRFYFGEETCCPPLTSLTARYLTGVPESGIWRLNLVPFADLEWNPEVTVGAALPSHPCRFVTLVATGPEGAEVDVDCVFFVRTSSTAHDTTGAHVLVGGEIPGVGAGIRVVASVAAGRARLERDTLTDRAGLFLLEAMPRPCVVELSAFDSAGALVAKGCRPFEIASHFVDCRLDPVPGNG